jgi:hypothetical protein
MKIVRSKKNVYFGGLSPKLGMQRWCAYANQRGYAAEFGSWAVYLSCQNAADLRDYRSFRRVRLPAHDLSANNYFYICLSKSSVPSGLTMTSSSNLIPIYAHP